MVSVTVREDVKTRELDHRVRVTPAKSCDDDSDSVADDVISTSEGDTTQVRDCRVSDNERVTVTSFDDVRDEDCGGEIDTVLVRVVETKPIVTLRDPDWRCIEGLEVTVPCGDRDCDELPEFRDVLNETEILCERMVFERKVD